MEHPNRYFKFIIIAIVTVTIAILQCYLFFVYPTTPKSWLVSEAAAIILIAALFLYRGNGILKHLNNPLYFVYNIIITTSFSLIALFFYKYYANSYCKDEDLLYYINITYYLKMLGATALFNMMSTIYYFTNQVHHKTLISEPTQIYETSKKDAELIKLRHQINPHFLFNALNSINALMQFDKDKARTMIVNLSEYYRNIINSNDSQWQTVAKELNDIQLYCNIEKIRFGHRLDLDIQCDETIKEQTIPPLLFQPLVENAIKYGLYGTLGTIKIKINILYTHSTSGKTFITFHINNPYDHTAASKPEGTGFGLENIKKRLYLLFATYKLFTIKTEKIDENQSLFHAFLSIPLSNKKTTNEN